MKYLNDVNKFCKNIALEHALELTKQKSRNF